MIRLCQMCRCRPCQCGVWGPYSKALWVVFWVCVGLGIFSSIACIGDVEVRSDGNMTCSAPAYDVTAFSCAFELQCVTKNVIDIGNSDWACACNVVPKRGKDLRLDCSLTSTTVEL